MLPLDAMTKILTALCLLIALGSATPSHAAQFRQDAPSVPAAAPEDGRLAFTILRNGHPIGSQTWTFDYEGDRLAVKAETSIVVRVLGITVYRRTQTYREWWDGDRLIQVESRAVAGGTKKWLQLSDEGDAVRVEGSSFVGTMPAGTPVASYWHAGLIGHERAIDGDDGEIMDYTVEPAGSLSVQVRGGSDEARGYRLRGDLNVDLWYDQEGLLAKARFVGSDGSDIDFVRDPD